MKKKSIIISCFVMLMFMVINSCSKNEQDFQPVSNRQDNVSVSDIEALKANLTQSGLNFTNELTNCKFKGTNSSFIFAYQTYKREDNNNLGQIRCYFTSGFTAPAGYYYKIDYYKYYYSSGYLEKIGTEYFSSYTANTVRYVGSWIPNGYFQDISVIASFSLSENIGGDGQFIGNAISDPIKGAYVIPH